MSLIFDFPIRQPLWQSVDWIMQSVRVVENYCCVGSLRLSYIEIPSDFLGDIPISGLAQCAYRSWGAKTYKPDCMDTYYVGHKKSQRSEGIYLKDKGWHWESRWRHGKLKWTGCYDFNERTVLYLLLEKLRNMKLCYLDLAKLARSPSYAPVGGLYWKQFLEKGIWAVLSDMRKQGNLKNPVDKTSLHPLDIVFRNSLVNDIIQGIGILRSRGYALPNWISDEHIRKNIGDRKYITSVGDEVMSLMSSPKLSPEPSEKQSFS